MRLLNQALFFKTVCCSCGNFTLTNDLYISIETGGYPPVLKCQGIGHTIGHFFFAKRDPWRISASFEMYRSFIKLSDEGGHLLSYETDL